MRWTAEAVSTSPERMEAVVYDTDELRRAAFDLEADLITRRRGYRDVVGGKLVWKPLPGDPFTVGQTATVQTLAVPTKNLGSFKYVGDGRWMPIGSSVASFQAMKKRLES